MIFNSFLIFITLLLFYVDGNGQEIKYHKKSSIACHNCFEKKYAPSIEDALSFTTTIELDIWDSRWLSGGWKAMNHDWYVKHSSFTKGNDNCCGGSFSDCLKRIKTWSDNNPNHKVITVFIDKKENWSDSDEPRKPIDLDELLLSIFSRENVFMPATLLSNESDLRNAALKGNWPSFDSLKGKVMFVITNSTEITSRNPLNEYIGMQKNNAICFVAPEIINENEITQPSGISQENIGSIVFYNLHYTSRNLAERVNSKEFVSRVYGCPETIEAYNELLNMKVNFIAMYNYKLTQ